MQEFLVQEEKSNLTNQEAIILFPFAFILWCLGQLQHLIGKIELRR